MENSKIMVQTYYQSESEVTSNGCPKAFFDCGGQVCRLILGHSPTLEETHYAAISGK
jgi:hypothetical protein